VGTKKALKMGVFEHFAQLSSFFLQLHEIKIFIYSNIAKKVGNWAEGYF
jgi:hypothetical protein